MSLGNKISELRREQNLTQKGLADRLGIGQSTVSEWENDEYEPTAHSIRSLALFFEVAADYLLDLEDEFGYKIKR